MKTRVSLKYSVHDCSWAFQLFPVDFVVSSMEILLQSPTPEIFWKIDTFTGDLGSPHQSTETGCFLRMIYPPKVSEFLMIVYIMIVYVFAIKMELMIPAMYQWDSFTDYIQ